MMQGMFAAQAATSDSPSQTIAASTWRFTGAASSRGSSTLMYGALQPDGRLTYCNAGHNPPLVMSGRPGALSVRRLECGGPIVGLFEGAAYDEETVDARRRATG